MLLVCQYRQEHFWLPHDSNITTEKPQHKSVYDLRPVSSTWLVLNKWQKIDDINLDYGGAEN